jgi:SAM-dependent methyltransferase
MSTFAYYPTTSIKLTTASGAATSLTLKALSDLPLSDLLGLSDGSADETGHTTWRGSRVFLDLLALPSSPLPAFFRGRRVLELGSGSGFGGLGTLLVLGGGGPAALVMSDADEGAVALSLENYALGSFPAAAAVRAEALCWTVEAPPAAAGGGATFETVLACDVVYDVSILPPLFATARRCLNKPGGVFVLSHVCRSCFGGRAVGREAELEAHIAEVARASGFAHDDREGAGRIRQQRTRREEEGEAEGGEEEEEGQRGSVLIFIAT